MIRSRSDLRLVYVAFLERVKKDFMLKATENRNVPKGL